MSVDKSVIPGSCTIRVFYPNPLSIEYGGLDAISKLYNVTFIFKNDPIYHELVFIDDKNVQHQIIGLAYHMEQKLASDGGIDVEA